MFLNLGRLLERATKPGIMGAAGMKREKACQRDLRAYFRLLAKRIDNLRLGELVMSEDVALAKHSAEMKLRNVLRKVQPMFVDLMRHNLMQAYIEGWRVAQVHPHAGFKESDEDVLTGAPLDQLGPSGERAADFASTTAAEMIDGINDTTISQIQDAIAEGIEERLGVGGTGRLIRQTVVDMSVKRANMIATTEMNRAFSKAALEKMDQIGIEYKRWVPVDDPCDECAENEDDGAIPVDEMFSSGDEAPPAHPNCRCAVVGARSE